MEIVVQGRVLTFVETNNSGIIASADGSRHSFSALQLRGDASKVFPGDEVDFQVDDDQATEIYVTKRANVLGGGNSDKNRFVAAALAFFLGLFGAHKFYLGRNGAGVTMLLCGVLGFLFFTIPTWIICVIAIVEAVIYLTSDEQRFEARYVTGKTAWF